MRLSKSIRPLKWGHFSTQLGSHNVENNNQHPCCVSHNIDPTENKIYITSRVLYNNKLKRRLT